MPRGKRTSSVEVTKLSRSGFWLLLDDEELFVPFERFPWFQEATIHHLLEVQRPASHHLYWPDLDIDLAVESIRHPERYPLVSKARPDSTVEPAAPRADEGRSGSARDR